VDGIPLEAAPVTRNLIHPMVVGRAVYDYMG